MVLELWQQLGYASFGDWRCATEQVPPRCEEGSAAA